jgi:hypothetical protein
METAEKQLDPSGMNSNSGLWRCCVQLSVQCEPDFWWFWASARPNDQFSALMKGTSGMGRGCARGQVRRIKDRYLVFTCAFRFQCEDIVRLTGQLASAKDRGIDIAGIGQPPYKQGISATERNCGPHQEDRRVSVTTLDVLSAFKLVVS